VPEVDASVPSLDEAAELVVSPDEDEDVVEPVSAEDVVVVVSCEPVELVPPDEEDDVPALVDETLACAVEAREGSLPLRIWR
jgi:hypothetical protein